MSDLGARFFNLSVFHEFKASHSLEGFLDPHYHLWKVSVDIRVPAPILGDRVVDMIFLQSLIEEVSAPLKGSHLNDSLKTSPTSENLCLWLWDRLEKRLGDTPLFSVTVTLCDLEGSATGKASLSR